MAIIVRFLAIAGISLKNMKRVFPVVAIGGKWNGCFWVMLFSFIEILKGGFYDGGLCLGVNYQAEVEDLSKRCLTVQYYVLVD
ncbi:hypothetical protein [Bacteroides faecalis]|uniref:Uncharacterized protein n=1 Tax=Bacteroides faecalis TaxID=2447885 RepID=A0A401LQ83_9BACE|nr:hypothetical protein [Bacteroides faecalis]GCB33716.1 hypothetical protein KGMB02408_06610 [Bacteroides faecalis]